MRFAIEAWSPDYGVSIEDVSLEPTAAPVDVNIERVAADWAPITAPVVARPERLLFVDGVRRVDARIWIEGDEGASAPGLCATVAAGAVLAEPGRARLIEARVLRGVFAAVRSLDAIHTTAGVYESRLVADQSPEGLIVGVQERMAALEVQIARETPAADLIVVDGPLRGSEHVTDAVGYIKTQHVRYLPDVLQPIVGQLGSGERTPLFAIKGRWSRLSWYLRLPGVRTHALSGIVRCEVSADRRPQDAARLADVVAATLPTFASEAHKDARSPQNLYPIAGLERELRRRLGDAAVMERALRVSAGRVGA